MGHVIPLHGDPHEATQRLLPWYVTDRLDPAEHALVAEHLATCAECRADLASEQRLRAEIAALPAPEAGQWDALKARALASRPPARRFWSPAKIGLIAASQAAIILLSIGAYSLLREPEASYHTLSATPVPGAAAGNIIVIFRPDAREQALRGTLSAVGARLVDGPTASGAYVLAVPATRRDPVLTDLRARPEIVLAQPIDGGAGR